MVLYPTTRQRAYLAPCRRTFTQSQQCFAEAPVVVVGKNKRARIGGSIKHAAAGCYNRSTRSHGFRYSDPKSLKPWPMSKDSALFQCTQLVSAPNRTNEVDTVI
jgi:hypothetical protein